MYTKQILEVYIGMHQHSKAKRPHWSHLLSISSLLIPQKDETYSNSSPMSPGLLQPLSQVRMLRVVLPHSDLAPSRKTDSFTKLSYLLHPIPTQEHHSPNHQCTSQSLDSSVWITACAQPHETTPQVHFGLATEGHWGPSNLKRRFTSSPFGSLPGSPPNVPWLTASTRI